jgi:glycolate oxidase FAD binding subunit
LFEGRSRSVAVQARTAAGQLASHGASVVEEASATDRVWSEHTQPLEPAELGVAIGAVPADVARVVAAVLKVGRELSLEPRVSGRAGVCALLVGLSGGSDEARLQAVAALRSGLLPRGASVVVRQARPELKARLDVWGRVGDAELSLMRRVKEQFDPTGTLSPGRFVGGI